MAWKQFQSRLNEKEDPSPARKVNSLDEVQKNVNTYTKQVDVYVTENDNNISTLNNTINNNFAFKGVTKTGVTLTAGVPVAIAHGLGRTPTGWFLVDQPTNSVVWRTAWDATNLTLDCTVNCTVALYIY